MVSRVELEGVAKREYNGLRINELAKYSRPVEATVAFGDKRLVFKGFFVIDTTKGSWKFGDQVQLVLWSRDLPDEELRAENDDYSRIEIALPLDSIGTLESALKKLWALKWKAEAEREQEALAKDVV